MVKLDGAGSYLTWSRACLLFTKSRKMIGYITGEKKQPVMTDATYNQWDCDNSLVMTWVLSTMHTRISKQYLLLDTAEKSGIQPSALILAREMMPRFLKFEIKFMRLSKEESRRGVMLDSAPMEKSGLAVSHEQPKAFTSDKDHLHCDYCGKPRHTKETCWKLHGRPTRGRGGKRVGPSRVQANIAEIVETSRETASGEALFSDEIQHLYRLLNKLDSSNVATSNYVQSGSSNKEEDWQW
uniref:Uncharacterized protein LOC104212904 isoform X2 n=1 Tax=Nicotiana sylvestris TaxID=4096 RepID=A0A1U7V6H2_NICSY|nr:PREDICTED: uncharacterized protein LOC104212904 isoform X2 [Nicotiana sylvestris]